ncbi:MAG: DUF502 domain-containing protein [Pseudomonadota bacterium]
MVSPCFSALSIVIVILGALRHNEEKATPWLEGFVLPDKKRRREEASEPPIMSKLPKPGLFASLRNSFLTGVVIAAPLFITVAVVYWMITGPLKQLDGFVQRNIPRNLLPEWADTLSIVPGFGVLVAVVLLVLLGVMAKNFIGRFFINLGERLFDTMPVVRNLYGFVKNVFEMALQQSEQSFKEVALVEYPRPGIWTICFVVTRSKGEVRHQLADVSDDMVNIFVPTTPNPTSGFLLFAPRESLRPLAMTVEEGAKLIFSAGLVAPEFHPNGGETPASAMTVGTAARGFGLLRRRQATATASIPPQEGENDRPTSPKET